MRYTPPFRPEPGYCSHCGRKGAPGGICLECGEHWHGTHTREDCQRYRERQAAREKEGNEWQNT